MNHTDPEGGASPESLMSMQDLGLDMEDPYERRLLLAAGKVAALHADPGSIAQEYLLLDEQREGSANTDIAHAELSELLELVGKIDTSGEVSEEEIAELFYVSRETANILRVRKPAKDSWQWEVFHEIMHDRSWLVDIVSDPAIESEATAEIMDIVGNMEPSKIMQINTVRLATRIWLDSMSDSPRAIILCGALRGATHKLLSDETVSLKAKIEDTRDPARALRVKNRGAMHFSEFAFAGLPMSEENAFQIASLCKFTEE
jgi:hypothetical protein